MLTFVVFVVGLVLVGGLLFLGSALLLGRGETQPPAELDRSPVELPDDRAVTGDDVRAVQVSVAVRGYRMTEVDWLLDQLAQTLDERDVEIARLRADLDAAPSTSADGAGPQHATEPQHAAEPQHATEPQHAAGTRPEVGSAAETEEAPRA